MLWCARSTLPLAAVAASIAVIACSSASDVEKPAIPGCKTCITVGRRGFSPAALTLEKGDAGATTSVTFTRTTDDTCARWIVVPALQLNLPLPRDTPVAVAIPTDAAGTLTLQCGTAAHQGRLVVQ